jgi:hypothetical protein
MSNKKISQLTQATTLNGSDLFAVVQSSTTKKVTFDNMINNLPGGSSSGDTANTYLVPIGITGTTGGSDYIANYNPCSIFLLDWVGGIGSFDLYLPDATAAEHKYRFIRFISTGRITANHEIYLTPQFGQFLDGSTSEYQIDRSYEGIAVWSDGSNWYRIQTKG